MPLIAMEAKHATDCAPWKEAIDPGALSSVAGAVEQLAAFPVLDATVMRVIQLCDDPDSTAADLVDALEQDATFAANLLRFANSAARSHPIRANTIRQAVMLVGRRALRRLALEAATYRFLERCKGNGRASFGQLHVHAINVATCAVATAEKANVQAGDTVHLAGLLHDVGKLVLPEVFGVEVCDELARRAPNGAERVLAEREQFGIDHAQCGALLAEAWGMPEEVASIIAWHHGGPTGVGSPNAEIACVQIADNVAGMLMGDEPDHALLEVALHRLDLTADILDVLADQTTHPEHRTGVGRLSQRVSELERLSQTDDLTGLANRRHWLQTARSMLADSGAGAIVLCDIDHFKALNERHGAAAGDLVLTELARIFSRYGHAGRLGGDEFAIFIPNGGLREAAQAAQLIMAQVEETFEPGSGPKVDLSLGCAAAPDHGTELAELLEAADFALLDAKRAGRSRAMLAGAELRTGNLAA